MVDYSGSKIKKETKDILESIQEGTFSDKAFGCIVGAFIGDSMGSYVEFIECQVPEDKLLQALEMPGGGPHHVGPG